MATTVTGKIDRKYMAHYIDATFGGQNANYVRLGKWLEEYSADLNPDVNVFKNILGENNVTHNGYQRTGSVEPNYCEVGDPIFEKLQGFVDNDTTDDSLKTTIVEVHLWDETATTGTYVAIKQDVYIVPTSYGGDTSGYQIPYDIYYVGTRIPGTFVLSTKAFTADS